MRNIIFGVIGIGAVLGALAFFNITPFRTIVQNVIAGSPSGTTSSIANFAGIVINLANPGSNATTSSILNGDAGDRYITSIKVGCEGVGSSNTAYTGAGLASLQFKFATSATAQPISLTNTNLIGGAALTISTSTVTYTIASSTAGVVGTGTTGNPSIVNIWPAGTYVAFSSNATNTASCTIGVDYFNS